MNRNGGEFWCRTLLTLLVTVLAVSPAFAQGSVASSDSRRARNSPSPLSC